MDEVDMTKTDLKETFAPFKCLNLAVLRESVQRGQVAFGLWAIKEDPWEGGNVQLCPIAHGWDRYRYDDVTSPAIFAGVPSLDVERFLEWWDGVDEDAARRLLSEALDELWAERVADADVVQSVIGEGVTCGQP
jgi:hypothetical protein